MNDKECPEVVIAADREMRLNAILGRIEAMVNTDVQNVKGSISLDPFQGLSPESLNQILASKLQLEATLTGGRNVRWHFVLRALECLQELKLYLVSFEDDTKATLLSVRKQKQISTLLQMVVAFGLVPNLIPGVGLSLERRSQFVKCLQETNEDGEHAQTVEEKYEHLCFTTIGIFKLLDDKTLGSLILTKYLGDLLSSLIQLSHAPLKKPNLDDNSEFVMTAEKYEKLLQDQKFFDNHLQKIIARVYQPLVVKYLLVIQSSGSSSKGNNSSAKSPRWLQKVCGKLLSQLLLRENGIMNMIRGILDIGNSDQEDVSQTQKHQIIAQVISNPPQSAYRDVEQYYKTACPQLLDILEMKDDSESRQFHQIACVCIKGIVERSLVLSRQHLLNVIMFPLLRLTEEAEEGEAVTEDMLENTIRLLHLLFVTFNEPSCVFLAHLDPVASVLIELHCSVTFGASHLRNPVEQLLQRYLKCLGNANAIQTLRCFAFREMPSSPTRLRLARKGLGFVPGENGGMVAKIADEAEENFYVADDEKSIALVDLLQTVGDTDLTVDFFMGLLKDLSEIIVSQSVMEEQVSELAEEKSLETKLLEFGAELDRTMELLRKNLMVIRLLGLLSEDTKIQGSIMKDSEHLLSFVMLTVHRAALVYQTEKEDETEDDYSGILETQSLNMALTLLSVKVTKSDMKVHEWERLQASLGDLASLEKAHKDERVRSMARKLRLLVATHGAVLEHKTDIMEKCEKITASTDQLKDMTRQMKELIAQSDDASDQQCDYQKALLDLSDSLLPIRGHGLITLRRLVEQKDDKAIKNISKIINIFKENLEDEDTFLYLQSINGLVVCANFNPELIIDLLTREFGQVENRKWSNSSEDHPKKLDSERSVELQTKIGEALVRITRNLLELTPAFKDKLLNPFLGEMNHPDPLVRASCLSNLGEICKNLKFSLGNIVQELFLCLQQSLQFDKNVEVRRAAVMVLGMLLQGLGRNTFIVLKDVLKDIWRALIHLQKTEADEALLIHTGLAIEEINQIVKSFLLPSPEMTKTIYVLDAPPDSF